MIIHSDGISFTCSRCGLTGMANTAPDVKAVQFGDETFYSIVCPNCGKQIPILLNQIPKHILAYVNVQVAGIMMHHD